MGLRRPVPRRRGAEQPRWRPRTNHGPRCGRRERTSLPGLVARPHDPTVPTVDTREGRDSGGGGR